jgi:pimeloyl-ACP methyl ester carboxylesterase
MRKEFGAHFLKRLTPEQIARGPKVIVYGYSLGAPAALLFSRMLQRDGVSIEMVVTIDSKGFTEGIFPSNVKSAVNFYEQRFFPILFGKRKMRCEDLEKTQFLGNIRIVHAGHLNIPRQPPVREAILSAVERAYGRDDKRATVGADEEENLEVADLPLRLPHFFLK